MANPIVTHTFTTFNNCNSVSSFSGWGANSSKWYTDAEIYLEGTGSVAMAPSSTGDGGQGVSGTSFNATTRLIAVWIKIIDSTWASVIGSNGIYIRLTSAANWTDYYDYRVGGSDVAWSSGGWHMVVLDANRTPDRTGGTAPTLTAITRIGVGVNIQYTSSKGNVFWIDAIRHGTSFEVVGDMHTDGTNGIDFVENGASADYIDRKDGGSWITDGYEQYDWVRVRDAGTGIDGDYQIQSLTATRLTLSIGDFTSSSLADTDGKVYLGITLEDVYQWDVGTSTYHYGVVTKNTLGTYEINFPLTIGDVSGAGNTWFLTRGEVITFTDQPIKPGTSDLYIKTAQDTGKTHLTIGRSSGSGDDRVGFNGSLITQDNAQWSNDSYLDLDQAIDEQEVFGLYALRLTGGCNFANDTSHLITSTSFASCGQVALGAGEARGLTFAGYEGTDGALLWNDSIDIKSSQFLANTRAIEHPGSAGSPYGYVDLLFGGNTYDVNNTSGSSITIGNTGSNATTYTGSTVSFQTTVLLKVTVKDQAGSPVENAQTAIYAMETVGAVTAGDELISGTGGSDTNASGIVQNTAFNYQGDLDVEVRSRKSSSGDSPRYRHLVSPQTIGNTGLNVIVTLIEDPVNT